jgi:hypothetical protein
MCFKTNKWCQYNKGKALAYEEQYQEGTETTKCKETTKATLLSDSVRKLMGAHRGYTTGYLKRYLLNPASRVYKLTQNLRITKVCRKENT